LNIICKTRGHFWRGIGSTQDMKEIKQVCQRCTTMRTVKTSEYKEKPNADSGINGEVDQDKAVA
jgi:prophage protein DUF1660